MAGGCNENNKRKKIMMGNFEKKIPQVLREFGLSFDAFGVETLHSGHINCTFKVSIRTKRVNSSFIVQRINTYVFRDPVGIMQNIDKVTEHIRQGMLSRGENPDGRVLRFLKRADGTNYFFEDEENFWRVYHYVPNSITYDKAEDPEVLKNAGASFGRFQEQLSDFPMKELLDTMPDFHNTPKRMENLFLACERDAVGRAGEIQREIALLKEHEKVWSRLEQLRSEGKIPVRVTHNDTKYNNILIDRTTGEAVCVIDLDTVTPGLCAYDFGDAVRFSANTAAEDEPDLSKVSLDLGLYEAFAAGFIPACRSFCSDAEMESLALGAPTMAFELAARFLEDYVNGDKYFKVSHAAHNLERGRNQLTLALDMMKKWDELVRINRIFAK